MLEIFFFSPKNSFNAQKLQENQFGREKTGISVFLHRDNTCILCTSETFAYIFDICNFSKTSVYNYIISLCKKLPINPPGNPISVRTLPSTLISLCFTIFFTSVQVRAYFSLLRRNTIKGRHSLSLCGPVLALGACQNRKGICFFLYVAQYKNFSHSYWSLTLAGRDAFKLFIYFSLNSFIISKQQKKSSFIHGLKNPVSTFLSALYI